MWHNIVLELSLSLLLIPSQRRESVTTHQALLVLPCHQSSSVDGSDPGPFPKTVSVYTYVILALSPDTGLTGNFAKRMVSASLLCPWQGRWDTLASLPLENRGASSVPQPGAAKDTCALKFS